MNLRKILVWGTGIGAEEFMKHYRNGYDKYFAIVGFIDNSVKKQGTFFEGKKIYAPENIIGLEWEQIVICVLREDFQQEILLLLEDLGIEKEKISCYLEDCGMNLLKPIIQEKYKDTKDNEIIEILDYLKNNDFSVFNQYVKKEHKKYKVYQEDNDDPYIQVENKRMYYPKELLDANRIHYLDDVFFEQLENSPHKYVREIGDIPENGVLIDAGVQEGNFSINYIDRVKKLYLIECEKIWCRVLEKTFAPYRYKVEICNKFLSKEDTATMVTLDTLVKERIDFLKMDIEGSEVDALLGGSELLKKSDALVSICSYHNRNDEKYIRFLLDAYGYRTQTSRGYMAFIWDKNYCDSLDFRRGVVYGKKIDNEIDNCNRRCDGRKAT